MIRRFCEWYLCHIGCHDWSLFRPLLHYGNFFRRECKSGCGAEQLLNEKELNYKRLSYDAFMNSMGVENYDNPYWCIGDLK